MMIWKTSKTFIKNMITESWDEDDLTLLTGVQEIRSYIDSIREDLWQNGYIEIDYSSWSEKNYVDIVKAAKTRLEYLSELEE
jgi:hypothetical protein